MSDIETQVPAVEPLTDADIESVAGGHIDSTTSLAHDVGTCIGAVADAVSEAWDYWTN